jgi:hypothetical protein
MEGIPRTKPRSSMAVLFIAPPAADFGNWLLPGRRHGGGARRHLAQQPG